MYKYVLISIALLFVGLLGMGQTKKVLKAKINIDSTIIHYPNDRVVVNADSCDGIITLTQWLQCTGPVKAYWKHGQRNDMVIYRLIPGNYRFRLFVNDNKEDTASAYVNVRVAGRALRK